MKVIKNYLDKQKIKVAEYDFGREKIIYSEKIQSHRKVEKLGNEEIVRLYILTKLVNEWGYKLENIEIEKEYDVGRPKKTKPRIDIIVKDDNSGNVFFYIELKSVEEYEKNQDEVIEKQLFSPASLEKGQGKKVRYLLLYSMEIVENEIKDRCILIDYEKFPAFNAWKEKRETIDEIPKNYERAKKRPYIKDGEKDLEKKFTHEQLDGLRKNLHNVLWGGGGTDDNDIFSSLVNIILAKIQDESEKRSGQKYDFQVFSYEDGGSFETNEELFNRINDLYKRALKKRLNMTEEELKGSFVIDKRKFSLIKLKHAVSKLEQFSFVDGKNSFSGKDLLGNFFEGIVREGFRQSKGQFFTHINIVKFLLWGLQLDKLAIKRVNNDLEIPYLIDPSAGSGTFLIEYMKFITENLKKRFRSKLHETRDVEDKFQEWFMPNNRESKWARHFIYGVEINFNLGTAAKVNMILHGDGSANIFVKDGLLPFSYYEKETAPNFLKTGTKDKVYFDKETNSQFDIVISNPPFSVSLENETKRHLEEQFVFGGKKNSENLFIERWYQLLKPNGRLGVVLPESVLDTTDNNHIRLFIYKYFEVKAIVGLPQLTFQPFTSTKTSLLFARKKTKKEVEEWNKIWSKHSKEWNYLKIRCENLLNIYLHGKDREKFPSIKDWSENKEKEILTRMIKDYIEEFDQKLSNKELIQKYRKELVELCKYDDNNENIFGFVNNRWVFSEVAKELNYQIFMAEVENVGYKRGKRGEKITSNELFRTNDQGEVLLVDEDGVMKTALDYIRTKIKWN